MSLLDSLVKYSNFRDPAQRSYSTEGRNRICLLDSPPEAENRIRPVSKSLSREDLSAKPETVRDMSRTLNRLFLLLNKKLRMIRYVFFVKLETLKKLNLKIRAPEPDSTGSAVQQQNAPVAAPIASGSQLAIRQVEKREQAKRFEEMFELLYLKQYERTGKGVVFQSIRKTATKRSRHQNLAINLASILNGPIKWSKMAGLDTIKSWEQSRLRKQLFFDEIDLFFRKRAAADLSEGYVRIRASAASVAPRIPSPVTTSTVLNPIQNSNNFSLTFSNLIENGQSMMEQGMPYALTDKDGQPNLDLVVPVPISNIRLKPINMRPASPWNMDCGDQNPVVYPQLDLAPHECPPPYARQNIPVRLNKQYTDTLMTTVTDQGTEVYDSGDSAILWLENSTADSSQEIRTLSRNQSFINYLKHSEVRESLRDLKGSSSNPQQMLRPPCLVQRKSADSHSNSNYNSVGKSTMPLSSYDSGTIPRESFVQPFTLKMTSDVIYEDQSSSPTNGQFLQEHHRREQLFYNPEDAHRRFEHERFRTPKRGGQCEECPSTPVHELKHYMDLQPKYGLRNKHSESTALFPTYSQLSRKESDQKNSCSQLRLGEVPLRNRTSDFYQEYLKKVQRNTQAAVVKQKTEESSPCYFDTNYYFSNGSRIKPSYES